MTQDVQGPLEGQVVTIPGRGCYHGRIRESSLEEPLRRGLKMRGYFGKAEKLVGGRAGDCVPKQRTNMVKELKAAALAYSMCSLQVLQDEE